MAGRLIGIGVGPGDPELLTLKAVRAIGECDVVAVPDAGSGERAAFTTVEGYLAGKELLECRFAMENDMAKRRAARQVAAEAIMACLDAGKDVGFITIGDPTTYSTYMYVHEIVVAAGYAAEIVPGITSFAAAAAALGVALCENDEPLIVLPGKKDEDVEALLGFPGNKVVMKSGAALKRVLELLKARGYGESTKIACRVTMAGEQLYTSIEEYERSPEAGYLTVAIVKERP